MAKIATVKLVGTASYSASRAHEMPKLEGEKPDDYDKRTWREHCYFNEAGHVQIPGMAFKQALDAAAKMLGKQIPGKGKSTYTKYFVSGVLCVDPLTLGTRRDDLSAERIYANSDGVRGSGKRVWRIYPRIDNWGGSLDFLVLAPEIEERIFLEHLEKAGQFVGVGRYRPEKGGPFGRFSVEKVTWTNV